LRAENTNVPVIDPRTGAGLTGVSPRAVMNELLDSLLNGLSMGATTFLVAAGLTLMFGILGILNFAHGIFFAVGAYVAFVLVGGAAGTIWTYVLASAGAAVVVGALGYLTDLVVLRRLRGVEGEYALIATFALLLIGTGVLKLIWGTDPLTASPPSALQGALKLGPAPIPYFSIFMLATGVIAFVLMEWVLNHSHIGKVAQAVARDPWMAGVMGINVPVVMTVSVVISFVLVGLAGGLMAANQALTPHLADSYLLLAFNAVIVGGLGSVRGAFAASFLLGICESLFVMLLPNLPSVPIYVALIAFLLVKPHGLFPPLNAH